MSEEANSQFISRLKSAPLLSRCGEELPEQWEDALRPLSWKEAEKLCASETGSNQQNERSNLLGDAVRRHSKSRYHEWNDIVKRWRPEVRAITEERFPAVQDRERLSDEILNHMSWDLFMACVERAYSDCSPPPWFVPISELYLAGFLPIGIGGVARGDRLYAGDICAPYGPDDNPDEDPPTRIPEGRLIIW